MEYFQYPLIIVLHIVASVMAFYILELPELWSDDGYHPFLPTPYDVFTERGHDISPYMIQEYLTNFYDPAVRYTDALGEYKTLYQKTDETNFGRFLGSLVLILIQVIVWSDLNLNLLWTIVISVSVSAACVLIGYLIFRFKLKEEYRKPNAEKIMQEYYERIAPRRDKNDNIDEKVHLNRYMMDCSWGVLRDGLKTIRKKHLVSQVLQYGLFISICFFIPLL